MTAVEFLFITPARRARNHFPPHFFPHTKRACTTFTPLNIQSTCASKYRSPGLPSLKLALHHSHRAATTQVRDVVKYALNKDWMERPTAAEVRVKIEAALEAVRRRGRDGVDGGAIQAEDVGVSLGV